jgi:hypothetical protein
MPELLREAAELLLVEWPEFEMDKWKEKRVQWLKKAGYEQQPFR